MEHVEHALEWHDLAWAGGWLLSVFFLFWCGQRLPLTIAGGAVRRRVLSALVLVLGCAIAVLAVLALAGHDTQIDLTRERHYTPSAQALDVARALQAPVRVTYYFQGTDPNGRHALNMLRRMAEQSAWLEVIGVDPDKQPSLAQTAGIKLYNAALIEADGRRVIVQSTNESEFAIGIQRALRDRPVKLCFTEGHHEHSVDNVEFSNEVERVGGHEHADHSSLVVETTEHGLLRWRRSLEGLGYDIARLAMGIDAVIPADCAAVIVAGPRKPWSARDSVALREYLAAGGAALLLLDVGYDVPPEFANLLEALGAVPDAAVVVDPLSHYGTDEQTVAVTGYDPHPVTERVAYTYFPGVRPLRLSAPAAVSVSPLVLSSRESSVQHTGAAGVPAGEAGVTRAALPIAVASEGRLGDAKAEFRAVIVGDADFVSNAHYPYMANSDLALGIVRWLIREEQLVKLVPDVPAPPFVTLTDTQIRALYLTLVIGLPLLAVMLGVVVWWRRR